MPALPMAHPVRGSSELGVARSHLMIDTGCSEDDAARAVWRRWPVSMAAEEADADDGVRLAKCGQDPALFASYVQKSRVPLPALAGWGPFYPIIRGNLIDLGRYPPS